MQKIDIICKRYELTQKDFYIKLDDVIKNVLRKGRIEKILDSIDKDTIIINDEKYITQNKFKELCNTNKWYKTDEINYILNSNIDFNIINFENNQIHIIIKDNIKYYRLFDLGNIMNYKCVSNIPRIINKTDIYQLKNLLDTSKCTLFGTDSNTNFITENGVRTLLLKSRKMFDIIEKLAKVLEININLFTDKVIVKESQCITRIKNILPKSTYIEYQYNLDKYFIDMYLPDYNLVIECDEFGHSKYNKEKELEREKFIKDKLNCKFIRINPDEKDFNFDLIIPEIYKNMGFKEINKEEIKLDNKNDVLNENTSNSKKIIIKKKKETEDKDKKKTNKCLDCDNDIYYGNERCTFCMNKKKFEDSCKEKNRPTKDQLNKDIKELGYKGTGEKYNVSDNCIKKWIKGYEKFNL
jgi:very-short-patch-repair endonuclease